MAADTFESAKDWKALVQHLDTIYKHESSGNFPHPAFFLLGPLISCKIFCWPLSWCQGALQVTAANGSPGRRAPSRPQSNATYPNQGHALCFGCFCKYCLCEGAVKINNRMPIFILFLLVSALQPFDNDDQYVTAWY